MPEYVNAHDYDIHLVGPDGNKVHIRKGKVVRLPDFFDRYVEKGFLKRNDGSVTPRTKPAKIHKIVRRPTLNQSITSRSTRVGSQQVRRQVVGRSAQIAAVADGLQFHSKFYPISNNIGVGILSYNRLDSLRRLVDSLIRYTDLLQTTVFIADDASTDQDLLSYLSQLSDSGLFTIINGADRLGVAGNSNRLLQCLSRFKYKFILNDDVEILAPGWDYLYCEKLRQTAFHHFCKHQKGVYGAVEGSPIQVNNQTLYKISERPHGAFMVFDHEAFEKVGYFDEEFGYYGVEHVDWSERVAKAQLQPAGFYDIQDSDHFVMVHSEPSAVPDRSQCLTKARVYKSSLDRVDPYVPLPQRSRLPLISCVIPFRDLDRRNAIITVQQNAMAQRYPNIEIIMVEHDGMAKMNAADFYPNQYIHVACPIGGHFNKSKAFNAAVYKAIGEKVILQDADTMLPGDYFLTANSLLDTYESCHLGKCIYYADEISTSRVVANKTIKGMICDKSVGYFEGGSLAFRRPTYWNVGGFNEDYDGYGCFLPDNYVLAERGYIPIQDVRETDRLYTHEGQFQPIELRERHYNGQVLRLCAPGRLPIEGVTPEHPFLVKTNEREYRWIKACELVEGMEFATTDVIPEQLPPYDFEDIYRLDRSNNKFDPTDFPMHVPYLVGLYLAEGVLQTINRLRTTYIYLNKDELELTRYVKKIVAELHPDINVADHYVKNNCRELRIFNSFLAKIIYAVAGKRTATNKIVSSTYLRSLSDEQLRRLLGGAFDGDANHGNGSEKRQTYTTSSLDLAMLMSGSLRRLGAAHSFGRRSGGSFPGSSRYTFDLCVNREFEGVIDGFYPKPDFFGSSSCGKTKFGRLFKIESYHYDGPVYNFEVKDDHSYVVNGLIVHNCEDCDFYARLATGSNWLERRVCNFVHLHHGRTEGWRECHERNKAIEAKLKALPSGERIRIQRDKIQRLYPGAFR